MFFCETDSFIVNPSVGRLMIYCGEDTVRQFRRNEAPTSDRSIVDASTFCLYPSAAAFLLQRFFYVFNNLFEWHIFMSRVFLDDFTVFVH